VVQTILSEGPSVNVIDALRKWGTALAIVASLLASAPAVADDKSSGCKPMPENVVVDTTSPINIGLLAGALVYYRCTEYDDQVKAALSEASAWVAARAPGVDKPAIVLDIDETSLSNWEQIYHNKFGYVPSGACDLKAQSACGQRDWELSAQATAIRPTLDLFNLAQKLKGKNGDPVAVFGDTKIPSRDWRQNGICAKSGTTTGAACSCGPIRAGTTNSYPSTRPCRASRSKLIIRSSQMSAISSATWSAIRMATMPSDASRSPTPSILFQANRCRAAASNAWRTRA
jgi:hypothetical protein